MQVTALRERADDHDCIIVYVDDSGPGLSEEAKEKLFEPFFTTKPDGTGLGLPTTRKIIEGHGGSVEIGTSPAGGARFTVRLPVTQPEKE